jgi:hypothetical protein
MSIEECADHKRAHLRVDAERLQAVPHLAEVGKAIAHEKQSRIQELSVGVRCVFAPFIGLQE